MAGCMPADVVESVIEELVEGMLGGLTIVTGGDLPPSWVHAFQALRHSLLC